MANELEHSVNRLADAKAASLTGEQGEQNESPSGSQSDGRKNSMKGRIFDTRFRDKEAE